ncbi:MAG TPA: DUF2157 domain-containing protein [Elusimicrobiales bacterium]|mgnify:CR=1 FL=1|nr:DUF2157 domain-containing protein [Elusimicrobiales bacterium]
MASYFKRLKKDLDASSAAGIITQEQAQKVFEQAKAASLLGGMKAAHWIAGAAGIFIALGVILVVASNWDKLGANLKIGAYLLLFGAAAEGSLAAEDKPSVSIPLELLWFFMPVIGIGLYAQIFQLSGDPVKPYLAWAVLSSPLAFLSKRNFTAFLTTLLLFAVLFMGTLGRVNMLSLTSGYEQAAQPVAHWILALAVLAGAVFTHLIKNPERGYGLPLGAGLAWLLSMMLADTALKLHSPATLLLAGMSASVIWLACGSEGAEIESKLPLTVWTAAVYAMTFFWHYKPDLENMRDADSAPGAVLTWALLAAALAALTLKKQRVFPNELGEAALGKSLLAASILCAFLLFGGGQETAKFLAVIANFILAALGLGLIMGGAKASSEKNINRGVAVLTITAVTRFIDIFGSMLTSGFAFIGTGLGFAGLAYLVNKGRKALIEQVKK